jgi:translation initiation factor 2 alpha subunit (eIF-2alpha)
LILFFFFFFFLIFFFFSQGEEKQSGYDVLQTSLLDASVLEKFKVPAEMMAELLTIVRHRMSSNPVKVGTNVLFFYSLLFLSFGLRVEAEINLTCFGLDGVDALKMALLAGREAGSEETPVIVCVKASPGSDFQIILSCLNSIL